MLELPAQHGQNSVLIDEKDIILVVYRGLQTHETITATYKAIAEASRQLRAQNKKVRILSDSTAITEIDARARKEAKKKLSELPSEKVAIYGKGRWTTLAMYAERVGGLPHNVKVFTNKRAAQAWLLSSQHKKNRPLPTLVAGIVIMAIGILALIGWQTDRSYLTQWISTLRPINPLSAIALTTAGFATASYWAGKIIILRWCGLASVLFGITALLPIHIDDILYREQLATYGAHVGISDSAAICFIAMGIVGLIANRDRRWVNPFEYILSGILTVIAMVNIFGQLYAHDALYSLSDGFVMAFNLAVAFAIAGVVLFLTVFSRRNGKSILLSVSRIGWLIVGVLIMVQFATYGMWAQSIERNKAAAAITFNSSALGIQNALSDRFTAYINALYGFQGLFLASTEVSEGEFDIYYKTTNVAENYPGLRALSFISKVPNTELPAFIEARRNDKSLRATGNPNFTITQKTDKPVHYIVTYLAHSSSPTGSDLSADKSRVAAYNKAEATQKPVASSTITFPATATMPKQNGFFISVPVAYQGTPDHAVGFVNAVFNYEHFFEDTFGKPVSDKDLGIRVTDTRDGKSVYDAPLPKDEEAAFAYDVPISVADRTWMLHVNAPASFGNTQSTLPLAVLIGGQAFAVLLIVIFWMQARGRRQAMNLADEITHDLQEERNLAISNNQKSTAILESIGDGVFAIDTNGLITLLNPAAQSISGYTSPEALGKPYDQILPFELEKNGKSGSKFIEKALQGHTASMAEDTILVRKDGKRIPVADSAAPIHNAAGKIIGVIVVFRDISTDKELDKAKTEFVSLASHQLRTPLSAINWYGEMLLNGDAGKLTKDQHEYINEIFEGSQRMVELVNSLLNVSRIEIGKLITQPVPNDASKLIRDLEKEMNSQIVERGLHVTKHIDAIPQIIADPKQLRMIIQNLLSNAMKYTAEKGTVTITLRIATATDMHAAGLKRSTPHWFFSVQDNGYGIPKDEQGKIFTKMFRADNVRKLDVEGTGLGLYIVKEIVEKMGGRVWFTSVESVGTTFHVVAPIDTEHRK